MFTATPHRKRRANKGRFDTGVVVTSNYSKVSGTAHCVVWDAVVCKDANAGALKAVDAIIDERTFHRNRFNSEHKLALVAPNVSQVRSLLRHVEHTLPKAKLKTGIGPHGMICIKVESCGAEVLAIISGSKSDRLFQVEEGFVNR